MIPFLLMSLWGCAPEDNSGLDTAGNNWQEVEFFDEEVSADGKATTRTYTVYNPTSGGCSSAVRLTASGSGLTRISPSGCVVSCTDCGTAPSFDSLTSGGTSSLSDTWYDRSNAFDKDNSSANSEAWCNADYPLTVRVTGTSVSRLQYWFTDDSDCWF